MNTYIDHGVGSNTEECGPLIDRLDLGGCFGGVLELL